MKNSAVVETQSLPTEGKEIVQDILQLTGFRLVRYEPVIRDIKLRGEMGKKKYGSYLMTHNGRDADLDLYQELCDAIVYNAQGVLEETDTEQKLRRSNDGNILFDIAWRCRGRLVEKGILG